MPSGYEVCLSFAGEDRVYVERVASALRAEGVAVFYDLYEQADLWGKDLYQHLDLVYRERAQFCVIFISKAYAEKLWTRHELRSAQARAFQENREYILPARFDSTELPGVLATTGFVDLTKTDATSLTRLIIEKLKTSRLRSPVHSSSAGSAALTAGELIESNIVACARCKGTGTRDRDGRPPTCPVCSGIGQVRIAKQPNDEIVSCKFCRGDGTRDRDGKDPECPACQGAGSFAMAHPMVTCAACNGTGSRDRDHRPPLCAVCKGRGLLSLNAIPIIEE